MVNRPLVYHWVAFYNDGTSYHQYNPQTFEINKFIGIDKDKLIKFGLFPFSVDFARNIKQANPEEAIAPLEFLPVYEIILNRDERLIYYRDVFISTETYHICKKCGNEFFYNVVNSKIIIEKDDSKGYRLEKCPICPNCGAYDYYECKNCHKVFNLFNDADYGMCQDCGREKGYLERISVTSGTYSREKRWIEYYLGKQSTIQGKNIKFILKIKENGDCEIL